MVGLGKVICAGMGHVAAVMAPEVRLRPEPRVVAAAVDVGAPATMRISSVPAMAATSVARAAAAAILPTARVHLSPTAPFAATELQALCVWGKVTWTSAGV